MLSLNAVVRLENDRADTRASTLAVLRTASVRAAIEFLPAASRGEGVRLRDPDA